MGNPNLTLVLTLDFQVPEDELEHFQRSQLGTQVGPHPNLVIMGVLSDQVDDGEHESDIGFDPRLPGSEGRARTPSRDPSVGPSLWLPSKLYRKGRRNDF